MKKIDCWVKSGDTMVHVNEYGKVDRGVRYGETVYPYRKVYRSLCGGGKILDHWNSCNLSFAYFNRLWSKGETTMC